YAQNVGRVLPPSGIPVGSLQQDFSWNGVYQNEPKELTAPKNDDWPIYQRWSDAFNVSTECTTCIQARGLAALCWLMTRTPQAHQAWQDRPAHIHVQSGIAHLDLGTDGAIVVWEVSDGEPTFGTTCRIPDGAHWVEAEVQWPDGRRAFAHHDL
ncbi:MAG: glycoside hydrolase family 9 protein, partial [Candidatus Xenobia bacterium]